MNLEPASISQAGGRKINEDSCAVFHRPPYSCFVVADGLGGHGSGDVASQAAIKAIASSFSSQPDYSAEKLNGYIEVAQRDILLLQSSQSRYRNMRTTVVLLVSDGRQAAWAHVGDSRLYMFRDYKLLAHTLDHSVPQALVRMGEITFEQIRFHEDRNRLLQALGSEDPPKIETLAQAVDLQKGDAFLLCSDGFWEWVLEEEMEKTLARAKSPAQWLEFMGQILLGKAKPGHDNYTAVGVYVS
ncbi:MAG TPA: protein phosphatase 2C domain-containing protein [Syntrophomonadaceae bacterium]|nr:protein phosphatase 2C domain-containing protein [Syntrophomonadaceae bacterium]